MIKVVVILFVGVSFLSSCISTGKKKLLWKSQNETVEYSASRKYGNYVDAVQRTNGISAYYNLKIDEKGNLLHVLKSSNRATFDSTKTMDTYRDLELLVTDTSSSTGPIFLGNPINGYYDDTLLVNNIIYNKNTKRSLTPLTTQEKQLFIIIDSVTKSNNINYRQLDTSELLGWFKYIF